MKVLVAKIDQNIKVNSKEIIAARIKNKVTRAASDL